MEDNNEDPIRRSIDDLLNDDTPNPSTLPSFREDHEPMNYPEIKNTASSKAKSLMNSLLKFYLSREMIEKNEYIQLKAKVDVMTLANLMNQMEIAEHAIVTLMRTIDAGEFSPRMFEVLGGLQKTMLDIMKHQTLHMMAAEENMKKLKRDVDIYSDSQAIDITPKNETVSVSRGTRNLMREIQSELGNEETDESDFDSENQTDM